MKKFIIIAIFIAGLVSSAFAIDSYSCKNYSLKSNKKVCKYNASTASKYALKYYNNKKKSPFSYYGNNCTHFVSQSILAGFVGKDNVYSVFNERAEYDVEKGESLRWYYINKNDVGNSWTQAHSLYLYVKSSLNDFYRQKYSGIKFKYVTRDFISSFDKNGNRRINGGALHINKVKEGDIIFIDYKDKKKLYSKYSGSLNNIKTDGIMEHAYIVTKIQRWRIGYNKIRVASNDNDYKDKGLGDVNSAYDNKIEFHIYRPYNFIEK